MPFEPIASPVVKAPTDKKEQSKVPAPVMATANATQTFALLEHGFIGDPSEAGQRHANALYRGMASTPLDDVYSQAALDPDANWTDEIAIPNSAPLRPKQAEFKSNGSSNPTGAYARNLIRKKYNLPAQFVVPLVHSGFQIGIQSPTNGEHLKMHFDRLTDQVRLGRDTYGLIFSTHTTLTYDAVVSLIVENIRASSLALPDGHNIIDYISLRDLPLMVTSLANAIWPNGYRFIRPCNTDSSVCSDVQEEIIDLSKLYRFNNRGFTTVELEQLGRREKNSVTIEEANAYRGSMKSNADATYTVDDTMSVVMRTPTIGEFFKYGFDWVSRISEGLPSQLVDSNPSNRETWYSIMSTHAELSAFGHMFKSFIIKEDNGDTTNTVVINNPEAVTGTVSDLSAHPVIRERLLEIIKDHIGSRTSSLIGLPSYTCPSCGKEHNTVDKNGKTVDFLPLDPLSIFFQMLQTAFLETKEQAVYSVTARQLGRF